MLRRLLGLAILIGACASPARAPASDKYRSYAELSASEREEIDYRVRVVERDSKTAVLVVHGGFIESGTSEIGRLLMRDDWSGYFFEGLKSTGNQDLHITSTRFDEPRAEDFIRKHDRCVSVHGFLETRVSMLCVGGGDHEVAQRLKTSVPTFFNFTIASCESIAGVSPRNIVNRCGEPAQPGLQLELSTKLRDELLANPEFMNSFVEWIRAALSN